jgi:hypothetical protein
MERKPVSAISDNPRGPEDGCRRFGAGNAIPIRRFCNGQHAQGKRSTRLATHHCRPPPTWIEFAGWTGSQARRC